MGRITIPRITFYSIGLALNALAITLNTKSGLGMGTATSIAYALSAVSNWNFSVVLIAVYSIMVFLQVLLLGKKQIVVLLLQIPFSMVFGLLVDVFGRVLTLQFHAFWQNFILACIALVLTGTSVWMMVKMNIITSPPDGLVRAISVRFRIKLGTSKNIVDIAFIAITILVGLLFGGEIIGVGIGTVMALIGVGRVIAVLDSLFGKKLLQMAGMDHTQHEMTKSQITR